MKSLLLFLFFSAAVNAQLRFDKHIDLGTLNDISEIEGGIILNNISEKNIFLLRADADAGVKVFASKKTIPPGDTALLVISFPATRTGNFHRTVSLVTSDKEKASPIIISGVINTVKKDNRNACYYFGAPRNNGRMSQPVAHENATTNSTRIHQRSQTGPFTSGRSTVDPPPAEKKPERKSPVVNTSTILPENEYKPNNLIFLVDISGSMKDSLKLPLMKASLRTLIDAARDIDRITFITYSDSVKVLLESESGANKQSLHNTVDGLRARGMTKGKKAINFSQKLAQKNFIEGGNNQIILASDGVFRFDANDHAAWNANQGEKPIKLSTVAFGSDREALKNLREISDKGKGSFIHIRTRSGSNEKLLEEIRKQSRKT